jgi:hypothetical protein
LLKSLKNNNMRLKILIVLYITVLSFTGVDSISAQTDSSAPAIVNSPAGGTKKFFMPGAAVVMHQFIGTKGAASTHTFSPVALAVFPLVKVDDRFFLDCGLNFGVNNDGSLSLGLVELIAYYRLNPWMSVFIGNFPPRYGVYSGILDDFTSRFGTGVAPVGMGHGAQGQNGIGIQGGFQAGYSKFNYQFYASNGPQLIVDTITTGSANQSGKMDYGTIIDNNRNKSIGGHIGFLPLSNSNLELTVSGQSTPQTGSEGSEYQHVKCQAWALGINYFHVLNPITVRVIAEYNNIRTGSANYLDPSTHEAYSFTNKEDGWFGGMTLRASGSKKWLVKNLEIAGRLGAYNPPKTGALWAANPTHQTTLCITEYLRWDIPISFEYDILTQAGSPTQKILSTIIFFRF